MAKIKQLPPHEAQKIAAGEVVERPANVVKELIENALDAGATELSLYLEDGGKKLIRIVDNGCGMSAEDARLSILHHATSKITTVDDLESINTFGFRGEALSSIASVSKMRIVTKEKTSETGVALDIEAGEVINESVVSANNGTDITIQDIFYIVPARLKFLKSKETEWRTIVHLFHALCLAYQKVSFTLYHEGRLIYTMPAAESLQARIAQLFEPALATNIHAFDASQERMNLKITGAVTAPHYTRFDRNQLFVFVNQRWVKNHKLVQALIKGYQGMLQPNRYPAGFLFVTLDAEYVDINIHPRKEEVQFLHPRIIEELIESTTRTCLEAIHSKALFSAHQTIPATTWTRGKVATQWNSQSKADEMFQDASRMKHSARVEAPLKPLHTKENLAKFSELHTTAPLNKKTGEELESFNEVLNSVDTKKKQALTTIVPDIQTVLSHDSVEGTPELNYRLIGQVKQTYIVIETERGIVFIDQHAAHERIMYERMRKRFEEIVSVRLLFPQIISITREDGIAFEPYFEMLLEFGIEAQLMSDTEIAISQTPVFLKNQSVEDCIKQAIATLHEYEYLDKAELKKLVHERVHAQLSCKAAVKAGDELTSESMHEIIKELYTVDNKLTCPHGRPTLWEFITPEIEKKFKRDYR